MDKISGPNPTSFVQLSSSPPRQSQPPALAQTPSRTDQLSLSSAANSAASSALEALKLLNRVNERPGGGLTGPAGESLTPEQALQRLSEGDEVLAKLKPLDQGARNVSALLFSLEDVQTLQAKIA